MIKKINNKEVWEKWLDYYDEKTFSPLGHYDREEIEERFFDLVPKEQRTLMAALISCLKWYPGNIYKRRNSLCGLCYLSFSTRLEIPVCENCPLYKKTRKECTDDNSLFEKAEKEISNKEPGKYCQKLFDVLLKVYKEEYEKVFGKNWDRDNKR